MCTCLRSGWRISLAGAGLPALVLTLGALFLPDTPNSLLDRGFPGAAEAVLRRVRGVPDVSVELTDIQHAAKVASQAGASWRTIFKRPYRAELTMARPGTLHNCGWPCAGSDASP